MTSFLLLFLSLHMLYEAKVILLERHIGHLIHVHLVIELLEGVVAVVRRILRFEHVPVVSSVFVLEL